MAGGAAVLAAAMFASLAVSVSPSTPTVDVNPREITALPNENVTIICNVGVPIYYCRFEIPGENTRNIQQGIPPILGIAYAGAGYDSGQCGISIEKLQPKHNGILKCSVGINGVPHEPSGVMSLTVAQSPSSPELQVDTGPRGSHEYYEGDQLKASCKIANGRPVANISWYLGERELREGLDTPSITPSRETGLFNISQNLTRTLSWADNGKSLRCVASHVALPQGVGQSLVQLNVEFPPKPIQQSVGIEEQDIETGKGRTAQLEIFANPKPSIRWKLGTGEEIREGKTDPSENFEVDMTIDKGNGKWQTKLTVHSVNEEILKADYQVIAQNMHGKEVYHVSLTPGNAQGLTMTAGLVIGIVIAVLVIFLVVFLLIFARATGRWCFAGGRPARNEKESESLTATALEREMNIGEPDSGYLPTNCMVANGAQTNERSDTESADQGPLSAQKKKSPGFQLPNFFKKKDKVSADPDCLTQEAQLQDNEVTLTEKKGINNECMKPSVPNPDGIVYAELDLQAVKTSVVVRSDDDKTEYAEIIHNPKRDDDDEVIKTPVE